MPRRSSWINVGFRWWQHPWRKDVTFEPQIPKPLRKLRKIRSDHVIPVWVSSLDRLPERTILTEIAPAAILEVATADLSLNHRSESAAKLRVRARRRCLASMDRRITFFRGTSNSHRLGPVPARQKQGAGRGAHRLRRYGWRIQQLFGRPALASVHRRRWRQAHDHRRGNRGARFMGASPGGIRADRVLAGSVG